MLQGNFFTIRSIDVSDGSVTADLELNPSHHIFDGHFPGTPVVPGVCMMQMIKEILENVVGRETMLVKADHIKFLVVINPNENKTLTAGLKYTHDDNGHLSVIASLFIPGTTFFKFKGLFHS